MKRVLLVAIFIVVVFLCLWNVPSVERASPEKGRGGEVIHSVSNLVVPAQTLSAKTEGEDKTKNADLRAWLLNWKAANGTAGIEDARALARGRSEQMLEWFEKNPARALAESFTWSEWLALPEEIRGLVERPFSAMVDFEVIPDCPPRDSSRRSDRRVFLDGEWHEAFVFGAKAQVRSKEGLPVRGIELNGKVVLAERGFETLSDAEAKAVATLLPRPQPGAGFGTDPAPGNDGRTILLGGQLHEIASEVEEARLAEVLSAAERSLHPKAVTMALTKATSGQRAAAGTVWMDLEAAEDGGLSASSTWTETPKRTLAVRINYSDVTTYSFTAQQMTSVMTSASNAVKVMSYGKTWLVTTVTNVTLPKTRAQYQAGGPDLIVTDTRTALTAKGINRNNYDIVVHAHPGMDFGYAGLGVIGGANNWLNGNVSLEVIVHELGHNYGIGHAHFWAGVTGLGGLGRLDPEGELIEREEYGDPFDIMGGSSLPAGQFTAHGKAALNWIEQSEVLNVVSNGIYRVARFDHKDARTNEFAKLALKVVTPAGEEYWISHRRLFTANSSLYRGASIVRADGAGDQSLIDTTPLSRASATFGLDREDSGLPVGKSFTDPLGTVRITTIAAGGQAPQEYLDVQVTFLDSAAFGLYTSADLTTNGLVGSYVNRSLVTRPAHEDWRSNSVVTISGRRVDRVLAFTSDGWGARAPVRVTGGTDANWENFSVQWDGYIVVRRPVRLATISDDSSRFWIDLTGDGEFGGADPEFVNNNWGTPQGATRGDISGTVAPGTYAIRIQYQEGNGGNYFVFTGADTPFELFVDESGGTPGLTGSFVAESLRTYRTQNDWRQSQTIAGSRIDEYPGFTATGWGSLAEAGLSVGANGSNEDWDQFSVQWDGYLKVSVPVRMGTISDDHSRMWIDLNRDGTFGTTAPELMNNGWGGSGQGTTLGQVATAIQPGIYPIRIQYEEGSGGNYFLLGGTPVLAADAPSLFVGLVLNGAENRTTPRNVDGDFTIQFWLKTAQETPDGPGWTNGAGLVDASVSGSERGFGVSLAGGTVLFGTGGDDGPSTIFGGSVADDQWHHVSARRMQQSGEISLFVDGTLVARAYGSTNLLDGATEVTVGSLTGGQQFFIGSLDHVKMWGTARTDEQIAADYHSTRNTHGFADAAPLLQIIPAGTGSLQLSWDPLSSFRILESASTVTGPYTAEPTDQNLTTFSGSNLFRFFRVRK